MSQFEKLVSQIQSDNSVQIIGLMRQGARIKIACGKDASDVLGFDYVVKSAFVAMSLAWPLTHQTRITLARLWSSTWGRSPCTWDRSPKSAQGGSRGVDGMAEHHDHIRQRPSSFRRVLEGFAKLREEGIPFAVVTTLLELNFGDLESMYQLFVENGVGAWHAADDIGYYDENEIHLRNKCGQISYWPGCQAGLAVVGIDSFQVFVRKHAGAGDGVMVLPDPTAPNHQRHLRGIAP
jgi:hypothetical protein